MKSEQHKAEKKQPYEKPKLRIIELTAEEVLGVGCKLATAPGPTGAQCTLTFCSKIDTS